MYPHCFKHLNDESVLIVDAKILHLYLLGILSQSQFVSPKSGASCYLSDSSIV